MAANGQRAFEGSVNWGPNFLAKVKPLGTSSVNITPADEEVTRKLLMLQEPVTQEHAPALHARLYEDDGPLRFDSARSERVGAIRYLIDGGAYGAVEGEPEGGPMNHGLRRLPSSSFFASSTQ